MKPIIAAFGELDHATSSLRWAAELATITSSPLEVVTVYCPTYAEMSPDSYDELVRTRRATVASVLAEMGQTDAEIVVMSDIAPIGAIVSYIAEHDAELAVLGTSRDTHDDDGFGFGGSAHHLLQHTRVPVVMVPPHYRPLEGGIIVAGVDGSSANSLSFRRAQELAVAVNASVHAVFAYDPIDDSFTHPENWHRHSEDVRDEVTKFTIAPTKLYMAAGHPTAVLLEHSARENAAMLVVGTRGHGGFAGLRLGRTPAQLLAHATSPVLVVPH